MIFTTRDVMIEELRDAIARCKSSNPGACQICNAWRRDIARLLASEEIPVEHQALTSGRIQVRGAAG